MNDYLSLLPSTLQWLSRRLSSLFNLPWPLWIGGLFPIYVAVVSVSLWFLRGRVWPVQCAYPRTSRGRDCQNWVPGEWARCRHHNQRRTYRFGHAVNERLQRWQTFDSNDQVVDRPERGVGTLRLRPASATLLYFKGYPRPPLKVVHVLPSMVKKAVQRLREARLWRRPSPPSAGSPPASNIVAGYSERTDIADGLERIVRATQFATGAFCAALVLTLIAVPLDGLVQTVFQYLATLGFVLAWAATSSGIYGRQETWLRGACLKSLRWWAWIFVPVGLLNLLFTIANKNPLQS